MGSCPNCSKFFLILKTRKCKICGKEGCDSCFSQLASIYLVNLFEFDSKQLAQWHTCSNQCTQKLADLTIEYIRSRVDAVHDINDTTISRILDETVFDPQNKLVDEELSKKYASSRNKIFSASYPQARGSKELLRLITDRANAIQKEMKKERQRIEYQEEEELRKYRYNQMLEEARNMEVARNFNKAGQLYEELGMYSDAGRVRKMSKERYVKNTILDINNLLKEIKNNGIVAAYRCPQCNAIIKIGEDTTIESIRSCAYCGSSIDTMELADFLKMVLS